ncbi:hypothetical protein A2U01_0078278, partial [Trifolium medium]|nr:hypothetical protein [Trifolium medium]
GDSKIGPVPGCKSMKNSTSLIGGKPGISDGKMSWNS